MTSLHDDLFNMHERVCHLQCMNREMKWDEVEREVREMSKGNSMSRVQCPKDYDCDCSQCGLTNNAECEIGVANTCQECGGMIWDDMDNHYNDFIQELIDADKFHGYCKQCVKKHIGEQLDKMYDAFR